VNHNPYSRVLAVYQVRIHGKLSTLLNLDIFMYVETVQGHATFNFQIVMLAFNRVCLFRWVAGKVSGLHHICLSY
jgi:hypothetical protein